MIKAVELAGQQMLAMRRQSGSCYWMNQFWLLLDNDLGHVIRGINSGPLRVKSRYLTLVVVHKLHCLEIQKSLLVSSTIIFGCSKPGSWGNPVQHSQRMKTSGREKTLMMRLIWLIMTMQWDYGDHYYITLRQWCWDQCWPGRWDPFLRQRQNRQSELTVKIEIEW